MEDISGDMMRDLRSRERMPAYAGFDPFGEHEKKRKVKMLSAMTGVKPVVHKHAEADFVDFNPEESALKEAFAASDEEYAHADPLRDAFDTRDKLAGISSQLTSELSEWEQYTKDVGEALYHEVKTAAAEGVSLGHVIRAWEGSYRTPPTSRLPSR